MSAGLSEKSSRACWPSISPGLEKELLIIDDGSTDGTRDILAELDGRDGVRVLLQPQNYGQGRGGRARHSERPPATSS